MRIGGLYFDEKDAFLIVILLTLLVVKFLHIDLIFFLDVSKLFIIVFLSILARIFYGKTREHIIFTILFFSILASLVLSYPGLVVFMIIALTLSFYIFKY